MIWAVREDHEEVVMYLIDSGADVNVKGTRGRTALAWVAAAEGQMKMFAYRIEKWANIESKGLNGWRPLSLPYGTAEWTNWYI